MCHTTLPMFILLTLNLTLPNFVPINTLHFLYTVQNTNWGKRNKLLFFCLADFCFESVHSIISLYHFFFHYYKHSDFITYYGILITIAVCVVLIFCARYCCCLSFAAIIMSLWHYSKNMFLRIKCSLCHQGFFVSAQTAPTTFYSETWSFWNQSVQYNHSVTLITYR